MNKFFLDNKCIDLEVDHNQNAMSKETCGNPAESTPWFKDIRYWTTYIK
jgi:hypothetical protein